MAAISITASSVLQSSSAKFDSYISAEAITVGQLVYQLTAGTVGLCDADASGKDTVLGIAISGAPAAGLPVVVCTKDTGGFTLGGTVASGVTVWSSATAGGITSTAADNATPVKTAFVGIGVGSNKILLNPVSGNSVAP